MGKGQFDLSEMFIVRMIYPQKAEHYVRLHGHARFGAGSLAGDVMRVIRKYGMVPDSVFTGRYVGQSRHNHLEMDAVLKAALDAIINNKSKLLSKAWLEAINGILDAYLGEIPEHFTYNGKDYTPRTFADELGINPRNYVEFTSFKHHPFYRHFSLELPDNCFLNKYYNIPLDEFMTVVDFAIGKGYTLGWDGDVSENTFHRKRGIAILPQKAWDDRTKEEQDNICISPEPEISVTQQIRQEQFDNYTTKDDHLMHVTGIAEDKNGVKYYIIKNSWGTLDKDKDGYVYMSESFFRAKTISVMVHREAVPKGLAAKLNSTENL
jgi:bleomycin hydrolase